MRKLFFLIIFVLMATMPAKAVLKEKNLESTLSILRGELAAYNADLERQTKEMQLRQQEIVRHITDIYNRSAQNSLMLYSQKPDYIFDMTYACHEATEMYYQFQKQSQPFRDFIENNKNEIMRYDSLLINLKQMPTAQLDEQAKKDRIVCLSLANKIRQTLHANSEQMEEYIEIYERTEEKLSHLNNYAQKRYSDIQSSIFKNGSANYFEILKTFPSQISAMQSAVSKKYRPVQASVRSQWDGKVILSLWISIFAYCMLAVGLNIIIVRYLLPKRMRTPEFRAKQTCITMSTSVVTLALILGAINVIVPEQNFLIMASGLLVQYAWLLGVILISLLLRLDASTLSRAYRIYAPLMVMGLIVIVFRIVLIPNEVVNIVFPPVLLACAIWQWVVVRRHNQNIPRLDMYYTYMSLAVFIFSVVCSMAGFTLFSVQALIWWIMQLTCILTITCISGWMKAWAHKNDFENKPITKTWVYGFCDQVIMPVLTILSIVIAIYWAADVFNMSDSVWAVFQMNFIDTDNFKASIEGISIVAVLYFLFAYVNRVVKELLALHFERSDRSTAASKNVLARNIVQIIVWGVWALIGLSILHVSTTWLAVIGAGLSTGVGFASKDIIENIYYGVSLMAGRVKIGDLIECDGYRGTVASISYTSTLLSVSDGSTIAFQNSQLFTKNYKNLTKNHGYELDKLEVGVAYGTDIDRVRQIIQNSVSKLPFLQEGKPVSVVLNNFGDSSINLKVLVWVPVATHYANDGEILETIYKALNDNNIEIPFPQLDIHNKNVE